MLDERGELRFQNGVQISHSFSLYRVETGRRAAARLRSNRSMRSPLLALRSTPVYAGWQLEQTSTTTPLRVDRVVNSFPHVEQRTVVSISSG